MLVSLNFNFEVVKRVKMKAMRKRAGCFGIVCLAAFILVICGCGSKDNNILPGSCCSNNSCNCSRKEYYQ